MAYWENMGGGVYSQDPPLIDETEEQGLSPYSVEEGTSASKYGSTQTTRGGSTSDKESETRKIQDRAQVYQQEFVPVNRTANASPYMSMLGQGSTPMADPRIAEHRALRNARTQALVRLAGNLGRMGASDADGVTGPISRDQSSNNYLTSMKAYHEALPKYNAALAKQNAALTKAQADLAKAQMGAQRAYDIQDAKSHNMVNYGNTKQLNQAERDYVTGNTVTKTGSHTNNTNNSTTSVGGWKQGSKQDEVRKNNTSRGKATDTENMPLMVQPIKLRGENGTKADQFVSADSNTVRDILAKIEKMANCDINNPGTWNSVAGIPNTQAGRNMILKAKQAQKVLEKYYNSEDVINGVTTKQKLNPWTIKNGDLNNVWSKESGNLLRFMEDFGDYFANEYGQMNVTYDNGGKRTTEPYTRWYGKNVGKRDVGMTSDYGTNEYYTRLN